jgi:transposase
MSEEERVRDATRGEPGSAETPAEGEVEVVPEAEIVEEAGQEVPEPDDDDLSPWYGDLDEDEPDLPPEESVRQSLHVPALDDEGLPVRRSPWKKRRGRQLVKKQAGEQRYFSPEERLLLLDTWIRSGLPAKDFSGLVGVSKHTLYSWKKKFDDHGPSGLVDAPRGARKGSRLPEVTKRAILMLKEGNPEYGVQRISDMLFRGPGLPASPSAVARVLHEAGYVLEESPTHKHRDKVRRFERAKPNQLWQTDIFTFVLKRQNRRVYLVAFMDVRLDARDRLADAVPVHPRPNGAPLQAVGVERPDVGLGDEVVKIVRVAAGDAAGHADRAPAASHEDPVRRALRGRTFELVALVEDAEVEEPLPEPALHELDGRDAAAAGAIGLPERPSA